MLVARVCVWVWACRGGGGLMEGRRKVQGFHCPQGNGMGARRRAKAACRSLSPRLWEWRPLRLMMPAPPATYAHAASNAVLRAQPHSPCCLLQRRGEVQGGPACTRVMQARPHPTWPCPSWLFRPSAGPGCGLCMSERPHGSRTLANVWRRGGAMTGWHRQCWACRRGVDDASVGGGVHCTA